MEPFLFSNCSTVTTVGFKSNRVCHSGVFRIGELKRLMPRSAAVEDKSDALFLRSRERY